MDPITPVILVLVTNKSGQLLEHSQFFKVFSVFGPIKKILIFERKVIWKVFVEYESTAYSSKAMTLDGTLFENTLKMRVHLSQRESLTFQSNNNCGVDYTALASKQQFSKSLQEDSVQFNQQLQASLGSITQLMNQMANCQTGNIQQQDIKSQTQLLNQIKEYRNQAQQLTILYQQQLRNYTSVLQREQRENMKVQKKITSQHSLSPSPYQQSTIDSIPRKNLKEVCEESSSSSDSEFKYSDDEIDEKQQQQQQDDEVDNYDDVFGTSQLQNQDSPITEVSASPFTPNVAFTPAYTPGYTPNAMTPFTPSPKLQQSGYVIVQHANTNLKVVYNLFSTFIKIQQMMLSQKGAVLQLASLEDAVYIKEILNHQLLLGSPLILTLQMFPPDDSQPVCIPPSESKSIKQKLTNALLVTGVAGMSMEMIYQFFNCITPIVNIKQVNSNQCKLLYNDKGSSLSVLGHLQNYRINDKSVQLSFTAF